MKQSLINYSRIVVKFGGSLLCSDKKDVDVGIIDSVAGQVASLIKQKKEIVLVSSGAVALGVSILGLQAKPKDISSLQAAAAIGQNELMSIYRKAFKDRGLNCAQVLLTWDDFTDRKRYLNAKNTIITLLRMQVVPIINENDTVAVDEIKFGDNDRLSALVCSLISADFLIILSDVDGLFDKDKKTLIRVVEAITPGVRELACPSDKKICTGGMITKIEAAKIAVDSGIPCVIANGRKEDIIVSALEGPAESGTLFVPKKLFLAAKKRWIAFSKKPKAKITVDDGAKRALENKKSLLSVGVVGIEGIFEVGDIVSVLDSSGAEFARGKTGFSSKQLEKVKGGRFDKEVIHRDNLVIL